MRAALFVVLVGCSIPEKHLGSDDANAPDPSPDTADAATPDASADPLGCAGKPLPTTAPAQITLSGLVRAFSSGSGMSGATVQTFVPGQTLATTTDGAGFFSQTISTNGVPVDFHVRVNSGTYFPTYSYLPHPAVSNVMGGVPLLLASDLASLAGVSVPAGARFLIVVADCNGQPLADAVVTLMPAPFVLGYLDNATGTLQAATMTDASGMAGAFSSSLGTYTISAAVHGIQLRPRTIAVTESNAVIIAGIEP
jgi:hypothetical protein